MIPAKRLYTADYNIIIGANSPYILMLTGNTADLILIDFRIFKL